MLKRWLPIISGIGLFVFLVLVILALWFGAALPAQASTLSDETERLRQDVAVLSQVVSNIESKNGVVEAVVSSVFENTDKEMKILSKRVTEVASHVDKARNAEDISAQEMQALDTKLNSLDEVSRRGWSYTPPTGRVTGEDIARAAVDLATSAQPQPEYTDSNDIHAAYYVDIHDRVLAGEDYRACSVVTSCAIHWSGADPDFPRNTSAIVHSYCESSPKWQFVGHSPDKEFLKPGDIFTSTYHTYMYIGNDIVRERFPESGADVYTGGNQLPFLYWDSYGDRGYDVYRFVG